MSTNAMCTNTVTGNKILKWPVPEAKVRGYKELMTIIQVIGTRKCNEYERSRQCVADTKRKENMGRLGSMKI